MLARRTFRLIYANLWMLRICFALLGAAYIHPDEHMQNGEVTSGDILLYYTIRTWEWSAAFPLRSIAPVFLTTGIPLWFADFFFDKYLTKAISPIFLFRLERCVFLVISGLIDYSLMKLVPSPRDRRLGLLLLGSSHVISTFQVRPFSNSIEAAFVSLSLVLLCKMTSTPEKSFFLHLMAVTFVIGIFTRPTFLIFGAPIAYQVVLLTIRNTGTVTRWLRLVVPPLFTAALVCVALVATDTLYFRGISDNLVVTPFNFVKYNFLSHNLADHGLHPRWLHVLVNLPMLVGPWVLWLAVRTIMECTNLFAGKKGEVDVICRTIIQVIIVSITVLSVQPHQEPRFLVPLVLPIVVLITNTGRLAHIGKTFWISCSIFNFVLVIVFGILHQGGVVPSLIYLHSVVGNASIGTRTNIVYWKTYMPPLQFLGVSERDVSSGIISFTDLAGAPQGDLSASLVASDYDRTFIVTPVAMWYTLPSAVTNCMKLDNSIFPHLDLDHISESIEVGASDGLRLGVYTLMPDCVSV